MFPPPATPHSYTLSLHDALPISHRLEHAISPRVELKLAEALGMPSTCPHGNPIPGMASPPPVEPFPLAQAKRSEEHTSELQSHHDLVCRLLLEKKKKKTHTSTGL